MLKGSGIVGGRPTAEAARAIEYRILAVASAIFIKRGYGGASMSAIAAEAHIGKQTLYRRYPNKSFLFKAVVNDRIAAASGALEIARNEADPLAELRDIVRSALEAGMDKSLIALHRILIAEVSTFKELATYASQWGSLHIERCSNAIERASEAGFPIRGEPMRIATSLLWSIVGDVFYRTLMGEDLLYDKAERDRFFDQRWAVSEFGYAQRE